ncbi:restriction endonuclease subunit S [Gelidibacter japonicus]|uniref:restriction endonuclease subunit S n=1 Tax=Gelidibacter japonicus TaxID=1962232 RepID=UPI0013CFE63A|nr:restriction endonuclease subunit S [Gelidibacter japonicus]
MRKDWIESPLGEVCFTTSGGTPSRANKSYYTGDIPWVKSGELDRGVIYDSEEHITEEAIKNSSAKVFPKGTLLFALYGATIGKMATLGVDAATNQAICGIYKSSVFKSEYLYHFLFFQKNFLIQQGIGGAQPNISQTILKKLIIPVAPLVEQKFIVNKIEELFSSLDSGIADLKKAQEQLVIYRQAVLKKAFEGDYTTKKINEIADVNTGATPKRGNSKFWENGTISWVTSTVVNNEFVNEPSELITEEAIKQTNCKLIPKGSLLIAMYGEGKTRGKCSELNIDTATNQALAGITLFEEYQDSKKFVKWFFVKNYEEIRLLSSGGVQPNLNLSIIKNTLIPFPERKQQINIIREIESRLSVCDKVEESIKEGLLKAEALRQSILKKAFEGTLLSEEEIATCKADRDYEPASVLLEKIKAGNKN